jgi:hypothetical protein
MAMSARAAAILERMEPNRNYEAKELRALAPGISPEDLHDVMRELWVQRQVERAGHSGWRRERSRSPVEQHARPTAHRHVAAGAAARSNKIVKPEDMFDHSEFEDIFK